MEGRQAVGVFRNKPLPYYGILKYSVLLVMSSNSSSISWGAVKQDFTPVQEFFYQASNSIGGFDNLDTRGYSPAK